MMKNKSVTGVDIVRFKELDARWRGERIPDKPMGLTADEPTEHRRLAAKLAQAYVASREVTVAAPVKVGFDIGGVLSKYPNLLRPVIRALLASPDVEVHVLTDIPDHGKAVRLCSENGFDVPTCNVHSCDYASLGEECKAAKAKELKLDVLFDDFMAYLMSPGEPALRFLAMPDPTRDYFAPDWKTDGSEGDFGRRNARKTV
jgi:hypothetical protein